MQIVIDNETVKFENWKEKFREQIEDQLRDIFSKAYGKVYGLTIVGIDKWNVEFVIVAPDTISEEIQSKINSNEVLKDSVLLEKAAIKIGNTVKRTRYFIEAKTEDELNSKLMYLNMMF